MKTRTDQTIKLYFSIIRYNYATDNQVEALASAYEHQKSQGTPNCELFSNDGAAKNLLKTLSPEALEALQEGDWVVDDRVSLKTVYLFDELDKRLG